MSTEEPQAPAATVRTDNKEIKIVSHSSLFYWWPVWAIGFIMALITFADQHYMVIVPKGTFAEHNRVVEGLNEKGPVDLLIAPSGALLDKKKGELVQPYLNVATQKSLGLLYMIVLLLVIVITNVPLRGLWSVVAIISIILLSVILYLAEWWEPILDSLGRLHIYMNAAGYLTLSTVLFIIWLVTFVFFDAQIYMVFTPRQLRVRQEIGGGEAAYDTTGMVLMKQRNDIFRHWVLGLGSGDLIVNTSGAAAHHFDMPNVLFVGHKLRQIEDLLREFEQA